MKPDIVLRICDQKIGKLGEGELIAASNIQHNNMSIFRYDVVVQGCSGLSNVVMLREPKSSRNLITHKQQPHQLSLQSRIHVIESEQDFYYVQASNGLLLLVSHETLLVFKIEENEPLKQIVTKKLNDMNLSVSRYVVSAVNYRDQIFLLLNDHDIFTLQLTSEAPPQLFQLQTKDVVSCLQLSSDFEFLLFGTASGVAVVTDLNNILMTFRTDCGELCGLQLSNDVLHAVGTCGRSATVQASTGLMIQKSSQQNIAWHCCLLDNFALTALVPDVLLLQKLTPTSCQEHSFRPSQHFSTELDSIRTIGLQISRLVDRHDHEADTGADVLAYSFTQSRCVYFQNVLPDDTDVISKLGFPTIICKFGQQAIDIWTFTQKNDKNENYDQQNQFPYAVHTSYEDICYALCKVNNYTVLCEIQVPPGALKQKQSK